MTSHRLYERVQRLLEDTSTERQLVRFLFILGRGAGQLSADLLEVVYVRNRTLFSKRQQQAQDRFNELRRQLEAFPLGQVFHEAIELRRDLDALRAELAAEAGNDGAAFTAGLRSDLERFYVGFESFLRSRDEEAFAALLSDAAHLYEHIAAVRRVVEGICRALGFARPPADGAARLTLHFTDTPDFTTLAGRLAALDGAYRASAALLLPDGDVPPLDVVKIETGGLWIAVDGPAPALKMLTTLLERFAAFLQLRLGASVDDALPSDRVTASQSLINLVDELGRTDADAHPESRVRTAAVVLRDAFVALLAGAPELYVNGVPYRTTEDMGPAYSTRSRALAAAG